MTNRERIEQMLTEGKSQREMAAILGCSRGTVSGHVAQIKRNGAAFGPPAGFDVKQIKQRFDGNGKLLGQSERSEIETEQNFGEFSDGIFAPPGGMFAERATTQFGADGALKNQWVKSKVSIEERRAAMNAWVEGLAETMPRAELVPGPQLLDMDLLCSYVIGDAHFGMMAWGEETGVDFDLKIAERELLAAVNYLVRTSPDAKYGLLVNVGDFAHINSRKSVTPGSGNLLDSDSRYMKIVRVIIRVFRKMIELMLLKHDKVKVICAPGNHDPDTANWMALTLALFYETEPRIEIDQHPGAFFYHRFGKNLIGVTHGDTAKFPDLPLIMAHDRSTDWGQTEHRYFWTGHIHHTRQQEYPGCFVESFNTLAPGDAWHSAQGYRAKRQMQRIDINSQHGAISRSFVNVGMI